MNALVPGYQLHWYRIKDILGQGGFGITYLAYDLNLAHEVAIKEYLPIELSSRSDEDKSVHPVSDENEERYHWGLERFIDEARTIGQFKHPNIVRVRNVFEANNTAYMVMDYELGESLQEILNRRKVLPEDDIKSVMFPIIDGTKLVHAAGYIHRDIKPGNIFIRVDGDPVLLDFGSARQSLEEKKQSLTSLFSKGYAPIEQYHTVEDDEEEQQQGPWTDIYSLGATMYRSIAGVPPTDAVDRGSAIIHTGKDTYVPAIEIGEGRYSIPFLESIDYALQFKRQDRPPTVSDWQMSFIRSGDITDKNPIVPTRPNDDVDVTRFTAAQIKAEEGDIQAQADLGYYYAKGIGTDQDEMQAFNWYYNAADQGDVNSQFNLGVMYAKGRGVKQNFTESFHWYREAANNGDARAQSTVAMMCSKGIGTEKNEVEAFNWYEKSAGQGQANSQYAVGECYAKGKGIDRDYEQAFQWYSKAANQGHINAQLKLGFLYGKGMGTQRDDTEAYLWIRKAAEAGHPNAQYNLGVIYAKGRGITRNIEEAIKWYTKASEQGDDNSEKALGKLQAEA
ncbi:MAG: serine/threonine-protein kinase [Thiotrichales bacterium]|nr:serine/threonine-protein kinase [Thiotrichales bacterium]